ncbi:uncharacterized protein N7515_000151 [Penicillium bovifimosum]|uniref:Uncharacterized protein n=1 Tax=Penicillium bovifimosum TaxID=126998 RepID=A0A9W9LAU6_9EURO|nr:uncharacterized protein N7515_000151 [Penicillium bovifimosum]KAJ5145587.1 hypothetical protein N7515_000151 [Penicillium bovifimosum]
MNHSTRHPQLDQPQDNPVTLIVSLSESAQGPFIAATKQSKATPRCEAHELFRLSGVVDPGNVCPTSADNNSTMAHKFCKGMPMSPQAVDEYWQKLEINDQRTKDEVVAWIRQIHGRV